MANSNENYILVAVAISAGLFLMPRYEHTQAELSKAKSLL